MSTLQTITIKLLRITTSYEVQQCFHPRFLRFVYKEHSFGRLAMGEIDHSWNQSQNPQRLPGRHSSPPPSSTNPIPPSPILPQEHHQQTPPNNTSGQSRSCGPSSKPIQLPKFLNFQGPPLFSSAGGPRILHGWVAHGKSPESRR